MSNAYPATDNQHSRSPTWLKNLLACTLLLLATHSQAASFDCTKAGTQVEKSICSHSGLSRLDDQLGALYRAARAHTPDPERLKQKQRQWLVERNRCEDADCLTRVYEERITELRNIQRGSFDPKTWVEQREARIKAVLEGKKLYIHPKTPSNTPFCHQVLKDLQTFEGMEVIAPDVIADGLDAPEVKKHVFDRCPSLYNRWGLEQPRKVILYHVDIDNEPANGREWVLGDHYVSKITPRWGEELLVDNEYWFLYVERCRHGGSTAVGGSQRYAPETDPAGLALDTGIHGVLRYRGKYYIYDVIDEPKVDPFGLQEYLLREKDAKTVCVIKERRN